MDFPEYQVEEDEDGNQLTQKKQGENAKGNDVVLDSIKFIMDEHKRTQKFINDKKKFIKEDVELAKKKYIKRNTLFKQISDDFKEHIDYDEINQKSRRYERKLLDIDFYIDATYDKIQCCLYALKMFKTNGQLELSKAESALKDSIK